MANIYEESLKKHEEWRGKITTELKSPITNNLELSLAYTPGVAKPCLMIAENPEDVYKYTWKGNTVAVITDGTAVLGLGDIGPKAGMPVMEGKCALFKAFAGVDAIPIALDTKDPKEIIAICNAIAPGFGGINLEDISAPRCVEIERTLIRELDIPVFHDDQHGTAIVVAAGLINALKLVKKEYKDVKAVISGAGAAGSSIIRMLHSLGIGEIVAFNKDGILHRNHFESYDFLTKELLGFVNPKNDHHTLSQALIQADVFIGVSAPRLVTSAMVSTMKKDAIVFAMANPEPEITYDEAVAGGAKVVGTGRSDFPNQINNVLAFPGLFRGALDCRASKITEEMKMAAAVGLASLIDEDQLRPEYVIPSVFDPRVAPTVAAEVTKTAIASGIARIK